MPPIDWYYAKDNKQFGPVNAAELKRLSQSGELRPEDLVWTEGMKEWLPARKIKGLFEDEPAPPAPIRDMPPSADRLATDRVQHPLDLLLNIARRQCDQRFVESSERLFAAAGHYGLYVVVLAVFFLFGVMGARSDSLGTVLVGIGLALVLLVLQYAAARFIPRIQKLSRSGEASLSSGLFLDCTALLAMTAGLVALVSLDLDAIRLRDYPEILAGLICFVTCEFAGLLALNPSMMSVSIFPAASASEEALGVLGFLLRLALRTVPVLFGAGVVSTAILLLYGGYQLLSDKLVSFPLGGGAPVFSPWLSLVALALKAIAFAALPMGAYLFYLFYNLILDLFRAILSLPSKLDQFRETDD
jgi:hypothetical protein